MSVELLRRAAGKLREHAKAASTPYRVDVVGPLGAETVLGFNDVVTNSWRDAAYVALMHPPVALALADWLDAVSAVEEFLVSGSTAVALARAILREES